MATVAVTKASIPPHCSSSLRKARTRTQIKQGRNLEAGADAEAMEELLTDLLYGLLNGLLSQLSC